MLVSKHQSWNLHLPPTLTSNCCRNGSKCSRNGWVEKTQMDTGTDLQLVQIFLQISPLVGVNWDTLVETSLRRQIFHIPASCMFHAKLPQQQIEPNEKILRVNYGKRFYVHCIWSRDGIELKHGCHSPVTLVPRKVRRTQKRTDTVMTPMMTWTMVVLW